MKTARTQRDAVRERTLCVPMTAHEKKRIMDAAAKKGLTMSAFVRFVFSEYFEGGAKNV